MERQPKRPDLCFSDLPPADRCAVHSPVCSPPAAAPAPREHGHVSGAHVPRATSGPAPACRAHPTPQAACAAPAAAKPRPQREGGGPGAQLSGRPSPAPYLEGRRPRPRGPHAHGHVLQAARQVHGLLGGRRLLLFGRRHPAERLRPVPKRLRLQERAPREACWESWSPSPTASREL